MMIRCLKTGSQGNSGNQHGFSQKGNRCIWRCKRDLLVGTCDKRCDMLRGRNFTFWVASDRIWQSILIFLILRVFFYILCVSLLKFKAVNLHFLINAYFSIINLKYNTLLYLGFLKVSKFTLYLL